MVNLNLFKAESVLAESDILKQISDLSQDLQYKSDGEAFSYEDYFNKLQGEIDDLPKLELQASVPAGTENKYLMDLANNMEEVSDAVIRVYSRLLQFRAKVKSAIQRSKELSVAFQAWYTIAAGNIVEENKIKIPAASIKGLAENEFTRLMGGVNIDLDCMLEALKVHSDTLKFYRKTQQEKFALGKDQTNASWTNHLPNFGFGDTSPAPSQDDEEDDAMPTFISRKPTIGKVKIGDPMEVEVLGEF